MNESAFFDGSVSVLEFLSRDELAKNVPEDGLDAEKYKHGLWMRFNSGVALNSLAAIYRVCLSMGLKSYDEWLKWNEKYNVVPVPIAAALDWSDSMYIDPDRFFDIIVKEVGEDGGSGYGNHLESLRQIEGEIISGWLEDTKEWLSKEYVAGDHTTERYIKRLRSRTAEVIELTVGWLASRERTADLAKRLRKPGADPATVLKEFGCGPK